MRLLELSLQPTKLARQPGSTTYTWAYQRLLFGQPVRLDVLGIALIDRLAELTWLGPLSVLVFGLTVGLVVRAASVPRFDLWMVLLAVGTFAGAYPLMYFAQEYIALGPAVLISAGFALTVIGVLAVTLMGVWLALGGVPPAGGGDSGGHPHRGHLARPPGHPAHSRIARLLHRRDAAPGQDPCRRDRSPSGRAGDPGRTRGTCLTRENVMSTIAQQSPPLAPPEPTGSEPAHPVSELIDATEVLYRLTVREYEQIAGTFSTTTVSS